MRMTASMAIISLLFLGVPGWPQEITPGESFAAGTAAFAEERFGLALSHFHEALAAGLEGPATHYNIGVCHYKLGDYRAAASAFGLIAERYPAMRALAEYNLGLVALALGDADEARRHFRRALDQSDDEKIRYLARRQLETAAAPAPANWLSMIDAALGYDDNVLLLDEEIPLPKGQSAESSFLEVWGLVTGPLSSEAGFRFDGSFYAVRYPDAALFDQTFLHLAVPYTWRRGDWRIELAPQLSHTTLDGDGLERRAGVGFSVRRDLTAATALGVRYLREEIAEGEERFAFLNGSRRLLEVRLERRSPQARLIAAYAVESNDRAAASVSPERDRLSLRYRRAFNQDWSGELELVRRESRYDGLTEGYDERLGELSLMLTRHLRRGWQVNARVSIADNDSELETVAYEHKRVSLGVTKQL